MAAFCVHIIKNAAKTTSKGKHNESEMEADRETAVIALGLQGELSKQTKRANADGFAVHSSQLPVAACRFPSQVLA